MDQNNSNLVDSSSQQGTSSPAISQSQPTTQSAPVEKTLTQSEVNSLVGRAKAEAEERGRQRALQEASYAQNVHPQQSYPQQNYNQGYMSQDEIRRIAAEESKRQHEEVRRNFEAQRNKQQAEQIVGDLISKLDKAKESQPDFEQKVSPYLNESNIRVLALANEFENTAEIVYELASRPSMIADIDSAYSRGSRQEAYRRLAQLNESIKLNKQAQSIPTPNEPLSQVKASPVNADDGDKSVSYYSSLIKSGKL